MNDFLKDFKYDQNKVVQGVNNSFLALYILTYYNKFNENVIILTSNMYQANTIYKAIGYKNENILLFPMDEFVSSVALSISPDFRIKRLEVLDKLKSSEKKYIIVTSLMGYLKYLPCTGEEQSFDLTPLPQNISREIIIKKLDDYGYNRVSFVATTGEYAVRHYIIDIFPVGYDHPVRLEFFDEELETIKFFDENSQITYDTTDKIQIKRFIEQESSTHSSLADYIDNQTLFIVNAEQIKISYNNLLNQQKDYCCSKELPPSTKFMYDIDEIIIKKRFKIDTINSFDTNNVFKYNVQEITNFNSNWKELKNFCSEKSKKYYIVLTYDTDNQKRQFLENIDNIFITNISSLNKGCCNLIEYPLINGFKYEDYIFITPNDFEKNNSRKISYKNTLKVGKKINSFEDLKIGDYIVHQSYGIGIYRGLVTLKKQGILKDYIQLSYLGSDKVYIPVENISSIFKYGSVDGTVPKVNKLGSSSWTKKKIETRKKIKDISKKLLKLYSDRLQVKSSCYHNYDEEIEFASYFPYVLTPDQEKAINEIDLDLQKDTPMDRLLCGDVGYGKTEVAFRAMFKTVINGYQVAYLCPTTILSKQQYTSALERFKNFPVRIELVNRYTTTSKLSEIINDLENGKIDIVIGTHKLLNEKIRFKSLDLLVIDEEQRFGVSHKEKIKSLKKDINVLTMSATPIPRTLKMAISGIRSMSVLDTPPINRYPVETYVIEENDLVIKDAIYKEISRDGQIFFLVNNINELSTYYYKINELVPESKVKICHGKMSNNEIDEIMNTFIDGYINILMCTTIIETGIDIPNVNTIIIIDSDNFGLSQLYQIRGRVGRSDKLAYAYLLYKSGKLLTESASKRLNSIKEFTELGSGYKIAMRDLAIRGAGDLLGSEQAGFVESVGIDMYTQMLEEEIKAAKGENVEKQEILTPMFSVETHISDNYIADEKVKIEVHKIINTIKNDVDLKNVSDELLDRFGPYEENIKTYMIERCTEQLAKKLNIKNIVQTESKLSFTLDLDKVRVDFNRLLRDTFTISEKINLNFKNDKLFISLNTNNLEKNYIYYIHDFLNLMVNLV